MGKYYTKIDVGLARFEERLLSKPEIHGLNPVIDIFN